MIVFCRPEFCKGFQHSNHFTIPFIGFINNGYNFLCYLFLFFILIKNGRTVAGSPIIVLLVYRGRVMNPVKVIQSFFEIGLVRIIGQFYTLGMTTTGFGR